VILSILQKRRPSFPLKKLISYNDFCFRISYQVRYNRMRLKITCSGFALVNEEASFIFHLVVFEKLGLNFFDLCNFWKSIKLGDFFQMDIKCYKMYFIASYLLLMYLHMDWKRYKSDFNQIFSRFRKWPKRNKELHTERAALTWYFACLLVLHNVRHC